MMKKILLPVFLFFIFSSFALIVSVYFAGIRLRVENQSYVQIENIDIEYGGGTLQVGRLSPRESFRKNLGKIGEGEVFIVTWNEGQSAKFHIYFDGHWGYNKVRIIFLPSGRIVITDNDNVYEPADTNDS